MADKAVVIILTIYPLNKTTKQREVVISGAIEGDMPVMHVTQFAGLHPAINQMWTELISRGAQTVKVTATAAAEPATTTAPVAPATTTENDQLVATPAPLLSSIDTPVTSEEPHDN